MSICSSSIRFATVFAGLLIANVNTAKPSISVSFGADITTWGYLNYIDKHDFAGGISQPCPAVVTYIEKYLPEQPAFYPRELYTDQSERFLASETIREVIYRQMSKELPYSAAVEIDDFKSMRDQHRIEIKATIYVERESQKAIFVGKKGAAIKQLGIDARAKLAEVLDANIHLELVVKVRADWSENPKDLKSFGYMETENS